MDDSDLKSENERDFPNHRLKPEIGIAEFNLAASRLNSEEQTSSWATNITSVLATAVAFVSLKASEYKPGLSDVGISDAEFKAIFLGAILLIGLLSVNYIANLIKSRVFSERKIVLLRRIFGVKYGANSLILPNWRIEGADQPLSIKLYPGFFSYKSFPLHVIMVSGVFSCFMLAPDSIDYIQSLHGFEHFATQVSPAHVILVWLFLSYLVFRRALREANEGLTSDIAKLLAMVLRVKTVGNFEIAIYKIRIEIAEILRVKADLSTLRLLAVFIEDKEFYHHRGVNLKGTMRAILGFLWSRDRGGGSSITQQLARGQFIVGPHNTIRRKIVEIALAIWLDSCLSKEEILIGYLATSRFERGVYGAHRAYRHFFLDAPVAVEKWEAFLLIERLGNIRSAFLGKRIKQIGESCIKAGIISKDDFASALKYYSSMIGRHFKLIDDDLTPQQVIDTINES